MNKIKSLLALLALMLCGGAVYGEAGPFVWTHTNFGKNCNNRDNNLIGETTGLLVFTGITTLEDLVANYELFGTINGGWMQDAGFSTWLYPTWNNGATYEETRENGVLTKIKTQFQCFNDTHVKVYNIEFWAGTGGIWARQVGQGNSNTTDAKTSLFKSTITANESHSTDNAVNDSTYACYSLYAMKKTDLAGLPDAAAKVISVNFARNNNKIAQDQTTLVGTIPQAGWTEKTGMSGSSATDVVVYDTETQQSATDSSIKLSWTSNASNFGYLGYNSNTADATAEAEYMYMSTWASPDTCDAQTGANTSFTIANIPFVNYDVIVYFNGNSGQGRYQHSKLTINNTTLNVSPNGDVVRAIVGGTGSEKKAIWGRVGLARPKLGINALVLKSQTASTFMIASNVAGSGVAAIQIVERKIVAGDQVVFRNMAYFNATSTTTDHGAYSPSTFCIDATTSRFPLGTTLTVKQITFAAKDQAGYTFKADTITLNDTTSENVLVGDSYSFNHNGLDQELIYTFDPGVDLEVGKTYTMGASEAFRMLVLKTTAADASYITQSLDTSSYRSAYAIDAVVKSIPKVKDVALVEGANTLSTLNWDPTTPSAEESAKIIVPVSATLNLDVGIPSASVIVEGTGELTLTGEYLDATNFAKFDFATYRGTVKSGVSGKVIRKVVSEGEVVYTLLDTVAKITTGSTTTEYGVVQDAMDAAEEGETVMLCANVTENVDIPSGVILDVVAYTITGEIAGSGTIVYANNQLPSDSEQAEFKKSAWQGTVAIVNRTESGDPGLFLSEYGNANSTIRFKGVNGWLGRHDQPYPAALELVDPETGYAATFAGFSKSFAYKFSKVKGSGTLNFTGANIDSSASVNNYGAYTFNDVSEFTGSLMTTATGIGYWLGMGTETSHGSDMKGKIVVSNGTTATIGETAEWVAPNGVYVAGVIVGSGTITGNLVLTDAAASVTASSVSGTKTSTVDDMQVKTVDNGNGTSTYTLFTPVAKIGDGDDALYFETVQAAIDSLGQDGDITTIQIIGSPEIPAGYCEVEGHLAKAVASVTEEVEGQDVITYYASYTDAVAAATTANQPMTLINTGVTRSSISVPASKTLIIANAENLEFTESSSFGETGNVVLEFHTPATYASSSSLITFIKSALTRITCKFYGDNSANPKTGSILDFGVDGVTSAVKSHLVFASGKHTLTIGVDGGNTYLASGNTWDNPFILVEDSTVVDLTSNYLSGFSKAISGECVIRVNDGGTLNMKKGTAARVWYPQSLYLEPGATLTHDFPISGTGNDAIGGLGLHGGVVSGKYQIYVPTKARASSDTATIHSTASEPAPLGLADDSNKGISIFVDGGSKLLIDSGLLPDRGAAKVYKYGTGELIIRGSVTLKYTGNDAIAVKEGSLDLSGATITAVSGKIEVAPGTDVKVPTGTEYNKITAKYGDTSLSDKVAATIDAEGNVVLDVTPAAKPNVTAMAATTEDETDKVSFTFTPTPGLFYSVETADNPSFTGSTAGEPEQATSTSAKTLKANVSLTGQKKVQYFRVSVKATK